MSKTILSFVKKGNIVRPVIEKEFTHANPELLCNILFWLEELKHVLIRAHWDDVDEILAVCHHVQREAWEREKKRKLKQRNIAQQPHGIAGQNKRKRLMLRPTPAAQNGER